MAEETDFGCLTDQDIHHKWKWGGRRIRVGWGWEVVWMGYG
jgi:hypothetical protein